MFSPLRETTGLPSQDSIAVHAGGFSSHSVSRRKSYADNGQVSVEPHRRVKVSRVRSAQKSGRHSGRLSSLENRQVVVGHLQDETRHGGGVLTVDRRV